MRAFPQGGDRFGMGIAPGGIVPHLLPIVDGPRDLAAALEVDGQLGRDLPCLCAIAHLQAQANAPVQVPAPRRPQPLVQHLPVQRMRKSVAPTAGPIRPLPQADVVEELVLRRQPFTRRFDVLHRALGPRRHRRHCKSFARHTGRLQHPPPLGREVLQAPDQQLPQSLRQTGHFGLGPVLQRPLPLATHDHPLSHQVLDDVHQEQRMALRALIDEGRESGGHRPPQAPGHIGRHILCW